MDSAPYSVKSRFMVAAPWPLSPLVIEPSLKPLILFAYIHNSNLATLNFQIPEGPLGSLMALTSAQGVSVGMVSPLLVVILGQHMQVSERRDEKLVLQVVDTGVAACSTRDLMMRELRAESSGKPPVLARCGQNVTTSGYLGSMLRLSPLPHVAPRHWSSWLPRVAVAIVVTLWVWPWLLSSQWDEKPQNILQEVVIWNLLMMPCLAHGVIHCH
ncbi:hypothetical protein EDB86DRAFT_2835643 [Lactarius hatsudake]|nr:hypothetical protein EDB86DRAFT_2836402 [Lactarius hatsudake]KAH8979878.1 hypothetical protein EDB86DRAFT_2835643 [Lactarius hatsudake]